MTIEQIADTANQLKKRYAQSDPFRLAQDMKILISYEPMGLDNQCCKGFFIMYKRMKHITINCDLPPILQKIVMAHELGHCVLHTNQASSANFHDLNLFDSTDSTEYEANIFASELLLTDEDVLTALNRDLFFEQIAHSLYVPMELLDFKFRILKKRGYKVVPPMISHGDFMKNLEKDAVSALYTT